MAHRLILLLILLSLVTWQLLEIKSDQSLRVPEDYSTIQLALDAAKPGDTILVDARSGPFDESIRILTNQLTLRSRHGSSVIRAIGSSLPVVSIFADEVLIEGFEFSGGHVGLLVEGSYASAVFDTRIIGNLQGVGVNQSQGLIFENNQVIENESIGILLHNSSNNHFTDNSVIENPIGGIFLEANSEQNLFESNRIESSDMGFRLMSSPSNVFRQNEILNNTTFGVSIETSQAGVYEHNFVIANGMGMRIANGLGTQLIGNLIEQNVVGIELQGSVRRLQIAGNSFVANVEFSLINRSSEVVIAQNNYWGSEDGPSVIASGQENVANGIFGPVVFDPWLAEPIH